jgi:heme a synthase
VTAFGAFTLWIHARAFTLTRRQRGALRIILALTLLQFGLGIATLLLYVPVALGVAHQVNAALLLGAAATLLHALRPTLLHSFKTVQ